MGVVICPKCGSVVRSTDTHCMDCGVNIVEAERELVRREKETRGGGPLVGDGHTIQGAAAGMAEAGETSEKVRLKEFDKHLAEKLMRERSAVLVTAIIALVAARWSWVRAWGRSRTRAGWRRCGPWSTPTCANGASGPSPIRASWRS